MRGALTALFAALLAGCGPEIGDEAEVADAATGAEGCGLTDSDPATDITWDEIRETLFAKRCGCHMTPAGFGATVGGLLLADRASALKGGRHAPETQAIVPGEPCASAVVLKTGTSPPFGARMPLSANPLNADERQLLIDWIAEGARK